MLASLLIYEKINTIATIQYSYEGCFGADQKKMIVFKKRGKVMANLNYTFEGKIKFLSAVLSKAQQDSLYVFINRLDSSTNNGMWSTTVEKYNVKYKGKRIKKNDYIGEWGGFSKLEKDLFNANF